MASTLRAAPLLALLALVGLLPPGLSHAERAPARPFARSSVWNSPLPSRASPAPSSHALVSELLRQRRFSTPWVNTTRYSTPVYTVAGGAAAEPVHVDTPSALFTSSADAFALQQRLAAVPIPRGARAAAGINHHMVIWQPASDTIWELWNAYRVPDERSPWHTDSITGWHAAWGVRIDAASRRDGAGAGPFGATASGLPLLGGLIRPAEWRSGHIRHALALGIPDISSGPPVWPATRTDGRREGPDAIPMGTRFRLDPRVNVDRLPMSPAGRAIARAVQRYGMIVRDHADGSLTFYGEDPRPFGADPYGSIFGGLRPDQCLRGFPWRRLSVVRAGAAH